MNSHHLVLNLIAEITSALTERQGPLIVEQTLNYLAEMDLSTESMLQPDPSMPAKFANDLDVAIKHIPLQLSALASAIDTSKHIIQWNQDLGQFYEKDADVGDSYRNRNMNCILIGPQNGFFHSDKLFMGLFFLRPRTFYRDHDHEASEMYFNLTGPHGFRFDVNGWSDYPADSIVWNTPWLPHATRVYDVPLLTVFAWVENVDCLCRVVHTDDWVQLENELVTASAG
jgi:hypothetical protein